MNKTKLWRQRYERDFWEANPEIRDWLRRYELDFPLTVPREIDDDYEKYRRDFLPKRRFGGSSTVAVGVTESLVQKRGDVLFRELVLVGRGKQTNDKCGKFRGHWGCIQHSKHVGGVVHVRQYFNSCDRPSCCVCSKWGWASREAFRVALRLDAASKMFGLDIEHGTASLPRSCYDLTLKEAKSVALRVMYDRGFVGGSILPHGNRVDLESGVEYYSPHFHFLAMLKENYRCRDCCWFRHAVSEATNVYCASPEYCDGYEQLTRRLNEGLSKDDQWIVKVFGKRETVGGSLWYQLNHASMNPFDTRKRVATYFGKVAYNNLGAKVVKPKRVCPECGFAEGSVKYVGGRANPLDMVDPLAVRGVLDLPFFEGGKPAWEIEDVGGSV